MVAVVKGVGPKPTQVRVRMYQVGFGDCFLLSFFYARALPPDGRRERHVLIDFGSTRPPRGKRTLDMAGVAQRVAADCDGRLDAIVVTHRHRDHLGGFGDEKAAAILGDLQPGIVLRPWTEDPTLDPSADAPLGSGLRFAQMLAASQDFALRVRDALAAGSRGLKGELRALAEEQIPNAEAITQLATWSEQAGAAYLHAGADAGLAALLPGVGVTVLGPPTVKEHASLLQQRESDPEYWMLQKDLVGLFSLDDLPADDDGDVASDQEGLGAGDTEALPAGPVRWLGERLRYGHLHSLKRLVTTVDNALNNTSLILLIEAGKKRMLFPGDAQIENWRFTLDQLPGEPALRSALSAVDLYKVGHHGSRNATPRSLLGLWSDGPAADREMVALLSTRSGVHGKRETTAVPRSSLVTALEARMTVCTTDTPEAPVEVIEVVGPTKTTEPFVRTP